MKIINYILSFSFTFIILSCKNEIKQDVTSVETIINIDSLPVVDASIQKYPIWILEFQRLRQALYQNDLPTIKSYFDFPFTKEQVDGLNALMNFRFQKSVFSCNDLSSDAKFDKYINIIFPSDFVKGLLPIKSDSLLQNNYASSNTWKVKNDDAHYSVSVSFDASDKTLS